MRLHIAASAALFAFTCWLCAALHNETFGFSLDPLKNRDDLRALTLYSEQAFYYSFFLRCVTAPTLGGALESLLVDTTSEHGHSVIPVQRFNVYPEAVAALAYRLLSSLLGVGALPSPLTFMLWVVWAATALQVVAVYWLGVLACRCCGSAAGAGTPTGLPSLLPGLTAALCFLANLRVVTRSFTNTMLRENFALPFLWLQLCALLLYAAPAPPPPASPPPPPPSAGKRGSVPAAPRAAAPAASRTQSLPRLAFVATSVSFMLAWQFGAFALLLQLVSVHAAYVLGILAPAVVSSVSASLLLSVAVTCVLMFGNAMLASSLLTCVCVCSLALFPLLASRASSFFRRFLLSLLTACGTLALKGLTARLFNLIDDDHVFRILKAKLPPFTYKDFDTMQYLCGSAYNELPWWVVTSITSTLLLPCACVAALLVLAVCVAVWRRGGAVSNNPLSPVALLVLQTVPFSVLGIGIMRLMMFGNVSLCILASLLTSPAFWTLLRTSLFPSKSKAGSLLLAASLAALLAAAGYTNLETEIGKALKGPAAPSQALAPLMELALWFGRVATPTDVILAGPAVSAAIHVHTAASWPHRPAIVLHPHAENPDMRGRYRQYYQVFGRLPEPVVAMAIQPLNGTYVVIDFVPCDAKCVGGFSYADIAGEGTEFAREEWARATEGSPAKLAKRTKAWQAAIDRRFDTRVEQFCFYATETKLKKFVPVYQNSRFLVLKPKQ